jgi:uroporphyrinogen-III decarboxylase
MDTYHELIENIRESRKLMSKVCDHNSDKYIAYLKSFNTKYSDQVQLFQELQGSKFAGQIASME